MKKVRRIAAALLAASMMLVCFVGVIPAKAADVLDPGRIPDIFDISATVKTPSGVVSSSYHFDGTEARYHADTDSYTIRVHLREQNADVLLLKSDPESESFDRRIDAEIAKNGMTQYCSYDFFIEVKDYTVPLECQFSDSALLQRGEEPDRSFVITFGLGASRSEKYYLDIEGPDEFKQLFTGAYIQRYFRGGLDGIAIFLESGEENLVTVSDPDGIKMEVWVTGLYEGVNTYMMEYWSGPPQDKRGNFELLVKDTPYTFTYTYDTLTAEAVFIDKVSYHFRDCQDDAWYADYVLLANELGLMTGKSEGIFAPLEKLSRAQFAVVLWRLNGSPIQKPRKRFSDVIEGAWYADAVAWASNMGIITGYTSGPNKGKFGTMDDITREQIAVMLYRTIPSWTLESTYRADLSVYADQKSISPFAREGLAWANAVGLINGKNKTTLAPLGKASRCECAAIILRYYLRYADTSYVSI